MYGIGQPYYPYPSLPAPPRNTLYPPTQPLRPAPQHPAPIFTHPCPTLHSNTFDLARICVLIVTIVGILHLLPCCKQHVEADPEDGMPGLSGKDGLMPMQGDVRAATLGLH